MNKNYLRPSEVLEAHPEIKKIWTAQDIGNLKALHLVDGFRIGKNSFVNINDVIDMFNLCKQKLSSINS